MSTPSRTPLCASCNQLMDTSLNFTFDSLRRCPICRSSEAHHDVVYVEDLAEVPQLILDQLALREGEFDPLWEVEVSISATFVVSAPDKETAKLEAETYGGDALEDAEFQLDYISKLTRPWHDENELPWGRTDDVTIKEIQECQKPLRQDHPQQRRLPI